MYRFSNEKSAFKCFIMVLFKAWAAKDIFDCGGEMLFVVLFVGVWGQKILNFRRKKGTN